MRIALGASRGLACLHVSGKVIHGNIKSSNILLKGPDHDASVSDFGLNPLFGNGSPSNRVAGYRAPETLETRKVTFKSDVYSFGVLLLELLTGKAPNQASLGEEGIDLPRWVQSVVREEWTAEVFDAELMRFHNIEEEMVQLLQIAMACVSVVPDQRPSMQDVVRMIEDMHRSETDEGLRQSSDDPSKGSEGHTPPPESRTPPRSHTP
jgi:serine/threonine protein kinase